MPVILPRAAAVAWLDSRANAGALQALLAPLPSEEMESYAVSLQVNNVRNNDRQLVEPLPA
jgi:putative SOS response-associated peptidase YedK